MKPENIFAIDWIKKENISSGDLIYCKFEHPDFGMLLVTYEAYSEEYPAIDKNEIFKFQSILRKYFLLKKELIICSRSEKIHLINADINKNKNFITLSELLTEFPKNLIDKLKLSLLNLAKIKPNYGDLISQFKIYDLYAKDITEAVFILHILKEKNQIEHDIRVTFGKISEKYNIIIKEQGWIAIEEFEKAYQSTQAFIAMWFDPSMNEAYLAVENACRKNGYIPLKIDNKEHNNEISGEILFEIKKSKFLISEVTGQRHGVYFEAGFAMGLGIPVIWCCKESDLQNVHFDTRQYNHIVWKNSEELFDKLEKRIKSTI